MNKNNLNENKEQTALLSGYVRYRPVNKTFYLMINSKRLADLIKKKATKVKVLRNGELFEVSKSDDGNVLKPRKRELVACISGRTLLSNKERSELLSENKAFSFPVSVRLDIGSFGLKFYDLYPDKDAAELARELQKAGVSIPERIMTAYSSKFDVIGSLDQKEIIIEITKAGLSENKTLNFRHQPVGGSIRAHLFDAYRMCVRRKLENKNNLFAFLIIDEDWKTQSHIKELIPECEDLNCYLIFSDFGKNWAKEVAQEILERVRK